MASRLAIWTLAAISLAAMTGSPSNAQVPNPSAAQRTPPRDARPLAQATGIAVIRGRVLAADGGRPLRRVQIRITAAGLRDAQGRTTSTDEDGRYEITDLPAGRYTVTATRGGFLPLRYGQRRPRELGRFVELADGQAVESVDFALQKMSVISGRITDEDGEPITGVTVLALRPIYLAGHRQLVPTSDSSVRTDDVGEYRIGGLIPGTYVVSARSGDKWTIDVGGREETMGYSPTYFPGTTNVADARRIIVGLGAEAKATDFSLIPGRAATVSGTAFDSNGRPFPSVNLALEVRSEGSGFFATAGNASVGADGTFTLHDVVPGDYKLTASSRKDTNPEVAILPIVVEGNDISDAVLTGSAGGTVSGHVVLAEGVTAKMPRVQISIMERLLGQPDPTMLGTFRDRYAPVVPAEDGSFVVSHVFGPARLEMTVPDGWMVKAIDHDGRDIADTPLEMRSGEQLSGVQISLTDRVTTVEGTLGDDNGAPLADGTVLVFTADSGKWVEGSRFVRAVRADQKGRYQVKGLPPGEYLASAIDYVEDGAWNEPEYLDSLRQYAQRLTLDAVEPQSLSLKVRSAP